MAEGRNAGQKDEMCVGSGNPRTRVDPTMGHVLYRDRAGTHFARPFSQEQLISKESFGVVHQSVAPVRCSTPTLKCSLS